MKTKTSFLLGGLTVSFLAGIFFVGSRWCKYIRRQQRLCPVVETRVPIAELSSSSLEKLQDLARYPFFFLGKGKQAIAYESMDGRYVLKFFKHSDRPEKKEKLASMIQGTELAYSLLAERTGIVLCSLTPLSSSLPVTLVSRKGKLDRVDLNRTIFILQKKATPLRRTIMTYVALGNMEKAKQCIRSLFQLLSFCRKNHVLDQDGALIRNENIGFIDDDAVLIDTGKLAWYENPQRHTLHDLHRLKPFESWLSLATPELLSTFDECKRQYGERI